MLSLRLLERVRDVPREAWDALARPAASPFAEWTWLDCLEEARCVGAAAGWLPRHFALYRGSDLVAIAPAYVKTNSEGEFVFDWSWADVAERMGIAYYPKLVFAIPFTPATGDRAIVAPGEDKGEIVLAFSEAARVFCDQTNALQRPRPLPARSGGRSLGASRPFAAPRSPVPLGERRLPVDGRISRPLQREEAAPASPRDRAAGEERDHD